MRVQARHAEGARGKETCVPVSKPSLRFVASQQPLCNKAMTPNPAVSVTTVTQQLLSDCRGEVAVRVEVHFDVARELPALMPKGQ